MLCVMRSHWFTVLAILHDFMKQDACWLHSPIQSVKQGVVSVDGTL